MAGKKLLTNTYVLTKPFQDVTEGKIVHTSIDLDKHKTFDSFLEALLKAGAITEEESNEYTSAYYEQAFNEAKEYKLKKLSAKSKKPIEGRNLHE